MGREPSLFTRAFSCTGHITCRSRSASFLFRNQPLSICPCACLTTSALPPSVQKACFRLSTFHSFSQRLRTPHSTANRLATARLQATSIFFFSLKNNRRRPVARQKAVVGAQWRLSKGAQTELRPHNLAISRTRRRRQSGERLVRHERNSHRLVVRAVSG